MKYLLSRIKYANAGLRYFFSHERNGRTQAVVAGVVVALGVFFGINRTEWMIILLCIALVLGLEMVNTSLEMICNFLTKDYDIRIKHIKDIAAAAVWLAAIISVVIGVMIFWPYIT